MDLHDLGLDHDLSTTLWMMPVIYIILMLLRFGLTAMFRPLFMLIKGDINTKECIFMTFAGLRGSASLIMGSAVVTQQFATYAGQPDTFSVSPGAEHGRVAAVACGCGVPRAQQQQTRLALMQRHCCSH